MSSCELSPSAHAFSTLLTAFVGSIINGLSNGAFIAFITGWIAWLAVLRVLAAAVYEYWQTIKAGTGRTEYASLPTTTLSETQTKQGKSWVDRGIEQEVTFLGWFGWLWSTVYTPISQTIWLTVNLNSGSSGGAIKVARAIAIGVSALALTFDNKHRYAASIGKKWGSWAFVAFNTCNATMCLLLGIECAVLLVVGATELDLKWFFYVIYTIFSCIWAGVSFKLLPPINGSRKRGNIFFGVLMGAFAGVFVAAPAFVLWRNAEFAASAAEMFGEKPASGQSLGEYLTCEGASAWQKFAAIMP